MSRPSRQARALERAFVEGRGPTGKPAARKDPEVEARESADVVTTTPSNRPPPRTPLDGRLEVEVEDASVDVVYYLKRNLIYAERAMEKATPSEVAVLLREVRVTLALLGAIDDDGEERGRVASLADRRGRRRATPHLVPSS